METTEKLPPRVYVFCCESACCDAKAKRKRDVAAAMAEAVQLHELPINGNATHI